MGKKVVSRSRKGNTSKRFVTRAQLKQENHLIENGQRFNPSPHPPDFMAVPWFNLIVRIEDFTSLTYGLVSTAGAVSVFEALRSQLNLSANDTLQVRFQSVRIWGAIVPMNSASALSHLRARFWSLVPQISTASTSSAFTVLEDISAYPDQVSRATIGFHFPKAQQSIPVINGNSGILVSLLSGGGAGVVAYVKVLWRPRQSPGVNSDDNAEFLVT